MADTAAITHEVQIRVSTEELQKAVDSYMEDNGVQNWKVTVSGKTEAHLDKLWVVCEDQIISGYGSNHMPEKSYYSFEIKDGTLRVEDSMNDEHLQDLLDQ